jgi:hypothetical protein
LSRTARAVGSSFNLSNSSLSITISRTGRLTSILDLVKNRELLLEGQTAGFVIFQDQPLNWDAWDVDAFHLETKEEVEADEVEVKEDGPLRASVEARFRFGQSDIKVRLRRLLLLLSLPTNAEEELPTVSEIDASFPRLYRPSSPSTPLPSRLAKMRSVSSASRSRSTGTNVTGSCPSSLSPLPSPCSLPPLRRSFLKWEIPLAITPTGDVATYENQFGFVQRSTHRNTTWQRAQFEVCGHRYADISEFGYGVTLLNDCKYGTLPFLRFLPFLSFPRERN